MLTFDHKPIVDLTATEHNEIGALAQPFYIDATQLLKRELSHCNHIYLARVHGRIAAFFMLNWETLVVSGEPKEIVYYGLLCEDSNYQKTKIGSIVCMLAILDVAARKSSESIIGWCTTATPIVVRITRRYWRVIQPNELDQFDANYYPIAEAIRKQHYNHGEFSTHPFVLKAVAIGTNYTETERAKLAEINRKHGITIIDKLGIDETRGDRLLILMDLPDVKRLDQFKESITQIVADFNEASY